MIKKIVAVAMTAMMALSFVGCSDTDKSSDKSDNGVNSEVESGKIELLKQDSKLTQDQLLSRIKAEKLIENNGYKDDDVITVMVTLPEKALIDTFNEGASVSYNTVAVFAKSSEGGVQAQSITAKQNRLISELNAKGLINSVEYKYNTVINAVAVTASYGNIGKIEALSSVDSVVICDTFNRPQAVSTDEVNSIINAVDVYETGIFNSSPVNFDGNGTSVAILDSGFDCSHSVFQNSNITNPMYTREDIADKIATEKLNASDSTKGLSVSDVYYSVKIPFKYDYADKDSDVFPYDSEHGTHVAGIIGGKDDVITGVAVNTQLVLMKVFPDLQEGAETDDIVAGLEDAVKLGVDAINMSLGSSCGFAREVDEDRINAVYDALKTSGISVITAASNSYNSAFGGEQGNTNMVTNPDSATVGSPSTYDACLSVASISGVKSSYLVGNGEQVLFFNESNDIKGDPNDFVAELFAKLKADGKIEDGVAEVELEYITVPGSGLATSYTSIRSQVEGKIALVRRGDNTFEEKAQIAKDFGAIACIIYNNIDGDILMSMGKSDHIPTISISKDDGVQLAQKSKGTLKIGLEQKAGPFMSDFSSWGPTPSLGIKPEITAHGGTIKSSVPGGGYDEISGTSMASPNLCGIVVLIRQYLKDTYPQLTPVECSNLCNQLLMSTATIVKNQEGNPYSPRKQGAGLASLKNAVNTKAYITVDGSDRSKIELGDDKKKTGVYTLEFNVVNLTDSVIGYTVSLDAMTESVSSSDKNHVAEKAYMLGGNVSVTVDGNAVTDGNVTVNGNASAKVKVVYTMSAEDKQYITSSFPYGTYVEGFVRLKAKDEGEIDLNAPFLAFFGDWTEAPMFDKTYYEVESQAHDASIDDEDKLKADYFATTPYGSYFYNYIIPLGTYLYDVDTSKYDAIPATEDHIAISNQLGCIDGISAVYAGLLRGAKTMYFTITDKVTGEVVYKHTDNNARKSHSEGGTPIPYYDFLRIKSSEWGLINNRQYEFKMQGLLDYGDGGLSTNVRNTFSFDFYLDDEAPIIKEASYEKIYDKSLKKDRYYLTLTVYDNQYVQSIYPVAFTSTSSYALLTDNPIPVYSNRGQDNRVRFEITDFLDSLYTDELIGSALAFSIDDYALNSNIYLCQLPGTRGDFKFTSNGKQSGRPINVINAYVGEVVDLTQYLYSTDATLDDDKSYLKHLVWSTYNTSIIKADAVTKQFRNGEAVCLKAGKTQVTVTEMMDGKQATITINVKERTGKTVKKLNANANASDAKLESLDFVYFDTVFAYSRAAQKSEIGSTGNREYISSFSGNVSFYPGEKIRLNYSVKPWYVEDDYEFYYTSSNERVAIVDEDGTVTALKEGNATITLNVKGSSIKARIRITVKSEFVIENRTLVAYKGIGELVDGQTGVVRIPDDEGILYIGAFAFCLYDTDNSFELSEDDFDANKIPSTNVSITKVIVPYGVEDVQKYAFYNCPALKEVILPETVKFVREYSFYNDKELTSINLENVEVVGAHAFHGCKKLENVDLSKCYAIGASGFEGCESLTRVDISHLRNAAEEGIRVSGGVNYVGRTFKDCTSLETVIMDDKGRTKLCREMFVNTAVTKIDLYETINIPVYLFARSSKLETVIFHNSLLSIGMGAFCESPELKTVTFTGTVQTIDPQAFYKDEKLAIMTLPDCEVEIGDYCFLDSGLTTLNLQANTVLAKTGALTFGGTKLSQFTVAGNNNYSVSADGKLLLSADGKTIILAAHGTDFGDYTVGAQYEAIASGAFAGVEITSVTIENPDIVIGEYAFAQCEKLEKIVFDAGMANSEKAFVGERAFSGCSALTEIENLDKLKNVDNYAFANTGLTEIVLGEGATFGGGVFFQSKITKVTIGANSTFGFGVFESCVSLEEAVMPEDGGVHFGIGAFALATSLKSIDLSKTDGEIENQTFRGCTSLTSVDFKNVKTIGEYAFADCSALATLANTTGIETIGDGAFSRMSQSGSAPIFEKIALDGVKEIGMGAFMGNAGLSEITLPEAVTSIDGFTFAFCASLQKVVLPDTLTEIGMYAFRSCENLSEINLGKVEVFGEYSFYGCASTYPITIDLSSAKTIEANAFSNVTVYNRITANELTFIGDSAFSKTGISSFTAPKLTHLGETAFYKDAYLTEFVFGDDIEFVGSMAFLGCSSLSAFAYLGEDGNKVGTYDINDYAVLDSGVLYTYMPSGKLELKAVPGGMTEKTLTVKEGTVRIDIYAGNRNLNITKIVLPDSLKLIGNYAFNGYNKLAEVVFNSYTAPVLETKYYALNPQTASADMDFFPTAELAEDAPGYDLLHNQFGLFGYELYYFTFKDLAGSFKPIKMVLSSNTAKAVESGNKCGYNGAVYEACFGKAENADKTDFVSIDTDTSNFIEYGEKVKALKGVTLADEKVINSAVTALNAMTQSLTDFGYTKEYADELAKAVREAKATLTELQVAAAGRDFKNLLVKLQGLPEEFDVSQLGLLREIYGEINSLTTDERILLTNTDEYKNYSSIVEQYNDYCSAITAEGEEAVNAGVSAFAYSAVTVGAAISLLGAVAYVVKKRLGL